MNKTQLLEEMASISGESKATVRRVYEAFETAVKDGLKKDDQIILTGFVSFTKAQRAARKGRNPQTGKPIDIKAAKVVKVRVGKTLKEAVQSDRR